VKYGHGNHDSMPPPPPSPTAPAPAPAPSSSATAIPPAPTTAAQQQQPGQRYAHLTPLEELRGYERIIEISHREIRAHRLTTQSVQSRIPSPVTEQVRVVLPASIEGGGKGGGGAGGVLAPLYPDYWRPTSSRYGGGW